MNEALARLTLDGLQLAGVRELCVCPGARNAPWVQILARTACPFAVTWFFEERAAAFFALGRIRATGHPVAVLTSSGTAAGELLPAAMEAHYTGLPLVLMTADRPRRFRGSGAPQAAEQAGLFGVYCRHHLDLAAGDIWKPEYFDSAGPVHLNVCFEEPHPPPKDQPGARLPAAPMISLSDFLVQCRYPLVVVGELAMGEREVVAQFLTALGAPVYLEPLSGLREAGRLQNLRIHCADGLLTRASALDYPVDGLLRIGGIPTHRLWRDLEDRAAHLPVVSVSRLPFSGLARPSSLCHGRLLDWLSPHLTVRRGFSAGTAQELLVRDREIRNALRALLVAEPASEPGILHHLSCAIERGAHVYLGNSLPVRTWDLAAADEDRGYEISASRGLNGIDGQVSTFLGLAQANRPNWAILGDLTALYDLAGPWPLAQIDENVSVRLVVINNGGGGIFERLFPHQPVFQNRHTLGFSPWATFWKLPYRCGSQVPDDFAASAPARCLIELRPDLEATRRFWRRYEAIP